MNDVGGQEELQLIGLMPKITIFEIVGSGLCNGIILQKVPLTHELYHELVTILRRQILTVANAKSTFGKAWRHQSVDCKEHQYDIIW
ncbi:hypothetical protein D3C87_1767120 [compost metagenome]